MAEQPITLEDAQQCVLYALGDEMELVHVTRRKKTYHIWVLMRTRRKVITESHLARLSVVEFAEYLNGVCGYKVFPDPNVYRKE